MAKKKKDSIEISDSISLRPSKMKDRSFLYDVVSSPALTHCKKTGGDEKKLKSLLDFQFESQCKEFAERFPHAEDYIIAHHKQRVGRIYIDRSPEEIRVLDLTILPEHQNQGIGTKLFTALQKESAETGIPVRVCIVIQHRSMKLAQRLGFKKIGMIGEMHQLYEWKTERETE